MRKFRTRHAASLIASLIAAAGGASLARAQPLSSTNDALRGRSSGIVNVVSYGADPTGKTDSTASIQAALDAHRYGAFEFPAQPNGAPGIYRISSIKVLKTQRLVGPETTAARLTCVSQSAACVVISDPDSSYTAGGMDNITIQGPGAAGSSIGLYLGGDPKSVVSGRRNFADGEVFGNLLVTGFHIGVSFGNNAWADRFEGSLIMGNGTGLDAPLGISDSGEATAITDTTIANNGVGIQDDAGFEFLVTNSALDYNQTAVAGGRINFFASNVHFEQRGGNFVFAPYGAVNLLMDNITFLLGGTKGSDASMIGLWPQGANVKIDGASIWSNHPVANFLFIDPHAGHAPQVMLTGIGGNGNGKIRNLTNATVQRASPVNLRGGGLRLPLTSVASLPACNRATEGEMKAVSDAEAPRYNGIVKGGGAVSVPVYCNGSAWTAR